MRRFIEIMWLAIAAFSAVEMAVGFKNGGFKNENFLIFAILLFASTFMYFFRKRQRKNIEKRKNTP
jgi:LPXTG-motif cell wall-anchored protein